MVRIFPVTRATRFFAAFLILGAFVPATSADATFPATKEELVAATRAAVEARDYERFRELIVWGEAGVIKRRVIRGHVRSTFGQPIEEIALEELSDEEMARLSRDGEYKTTLDVTHTLRMRFGPPESTGRRSLSSLVYLVGMKDGFYRLGLMLQERRDDDGD